MAPVEIAKNGEEWLRKVNAQYFDVIVSDVDMPIVNSIEFYERTALDNPKIGSDSYSCLVL